MIYRFKGGQQMVEMRSQEFKGVTFSSRGGGGEYISLPVFLKATKWNPAMQRRVAIFCFNLNFILKKNYI